MKDQGTIRTVTGSVAVTEMGVTYAHEHLATHATAALARENEDFLLDDPNKVGQDLAAFRRLGGKTIVEMTTRDYGHDPRMLADLASAAEVNVIAASGFNVGAYCRPFCEGRDPDDLAVEQVADVTTGIGDTGLFAGLHKFATSLNQILPWEEVAGRAAARAHLQTGAPVMTHTQAGSMAWEQLDLLESEGVQPERVVLCHLDRNPDLELHRRLIERGAFLSYDQVPKPKYHTEAPAIDLIVALAREGLHTHLLVSGDFSRRSYFAGWGGGPGLAYLLERFTPKLKERLVREGLDANEIWRALFIENPARAFALMS